jgi:hypothetical protein
MLSSETVLPYAVLTSAAISPVVRCPSMALSTRCSSWVNWMTWPSARLTSAGGVRYPDPYDWEISSTPSASTGTTAGPGAATPDPTEIRPGVMEGTDYWLLSNS